MGRLCGLRDRDRCVSALGSTYLGGTVGPHASNIFVSYQFRLFEAETWGEKMRFKPSPPPPGSPPTSRLPSQRNSFFELRSLCLMGIPVLSKLLTNFTKPGDEMGKVFGLTSSRFEHAVRRKG